MNVTRGDVVLIDFSQSSGRISKVRSALVVQNDRDNQRLVNTIVAQITSLTRRSLEPTQLLIELATPEGKQSGLKLDSVVNCVNLVTIEKDKVLRVLGGLPGTVMIKANGCLRAALALP